jgi:hypothetical protein
MLNQKDPSSQIALRPDFTGMYNGTLVVKGEAKAERSQIPTAIAELISKFHKTAQLMFPRNSPQIPGFASCRDCISLHSIYYSADRRAFCADLVMLYDTSTMLARLQFIVDIFKIAIWIVSQVPPIQQFHLVSDVRLRTRNGHFVTLRANGILKEFRDVKRIPMEIIKIIYDTKLPNVEQGSVNCSSITITSIGWQVADALRLGIVTKEAVLARSHDAVHQLHSLGYAHCDICLDNIFVNVDTNAVFLGDLEYCRPLDEAAPEGLRRSNMSAKTACALDILQLEKLAEEIVRL